MNNSQVDQLFSYFNELGKGKKILLVLRNDVDYDTISGMIAFKSIVEEAYQNTVDIVFNKEVSAKYKKLLERYGITYTTKLAKTKYIIKINYADESGAEIDRIKWDDDGEDLFLYITPLKGKFDFSRVSFNKAGADYDSVVVFGCRNLSWLDPIYSQSEYLFQDASVVNFNNLSGNQIFGNLKVGEEGVPISVVVYYFAKRLNVFSSKDTEKVKNIVASLTEGVLSSIQIMQIGEVPDGAAGVISELSSVGGNIKQAFSDIYMFYQKGAVELQRIIMKNMKNDEKSGVYWSVVNKSEIKNAIGFVSDVDMGGKTIFNIAANHKIAFVLYEYEKEVKGVLEVNDRNLNAKEIVGNYTMGGDKYRTVFVAKDRLVSTVEKELLSNIKSILGVEISATEKYNSSQPEMKSEKVESDSSSKDEEKPKQEADHNNEPKGKSGESKNSGGLITPPPLVSGTSAKDSK
ncbi:hypothetical protein JW962_00155 [Candidatus Dojkabacteria bacterium]|nr:hypothetical protein [Candidatus Dojkabacteria bacterium]